MSRWDDLAGTYRLVVSSELLAYIERAFVRDNAPSERDAIRADALREAHGAEIEIAADGTFVSRSNGKELYRAQLTRDPGELAAAGFVKPSGDGVALELLDRDTLRALQPGKPPTEFRRLK